MSKALLQMNTGIKIAGSVFTAVLLTFIALPFFTKAAGANHSWGNYHWARTSNPFTLGLGDNVNSIWDTHLNTAAVDWSNSSVLDTVIVAGGANPKNCRASRGKVEVCNSKYGNNGWLGVAQIWASGDHISQSTVKVNDTYFNTPRYNTPAWRNLVMCQEVGHTLGLDHQDENFYNNPLGTCMDYSSDPNPNQHPNQHDYDQLETIYAHLTDTISTVGPIPASFAKGDFPNRSEWGKELKNNGKVGLYMRDFGSGNKLFTFVIWAQD